jgi:hypothetical protein
MISVCPFCGKALAEALISSGLTACLNCNKIIESSLYNRLLSSGWEVRRGNHDLSRLRFDQRLSEEEAILVLAFVSDHGFSHDDFQKALKKLGIKSE